jgi:hypothetical protein
MENSEIGMRFTHPLRNRFTHLGMDAADMRELTAATTADAFHARA